MKMNFDVELTWQYGWKHFFGFSDLSNSDDTLFICMVRDPVDWYNSFYKKPHHLKPENKKDVDAFLHNELHSYNFKQNIEIKEDRNMYTNTPWKNVVELRHTKLQYLIETLPPLVKHVILIRYEDMLQDFNKVLHRIKDCGLHVKQSIAFPVNSMKDFGPGQRGNYVKKTHSDITKEMIETHPSFIPTYETQLGYM